ncbi:hypothetical protein ABID96_003725 [Bacillus sp. OAE603]
MKGLVYKPVKNAPIYRGIFFEIHINFTLYLYKVNIVKLYFKLGVYVIKLGNVV